ncbi:hypothetical protein B0T14DRAFT_291125 [Immersiella caudata]|uniref:Uncharacterized protein n=1 Tax=Immersiella caudata TaxID=314043 RepID=A0AA40BUC9_9PEZI|nr:hypothetical protein B0T14DRAFT_291125 [Immersiella caudata]
MLCETTRVLSGGDNFCGLSPKVVDSLADQPPSRKGARGARLSFANEPLANYSSAPQRLPNHKATAPHPPLPSSARRPEVVRRVRGAFARWTCLATGFSLFSVAEQPTRAAGKRKGSRSPVLCPVASRRQRLSARFHVSSTELGPVVI